MPLVTAIWGTIREAPAKRNMQQGCAVVVMAAIDENRIDAVVRQGLRSFERRCS